MGKVASKCRLVAAVEAATEAAAEVEVELEVEVEVELEVEVDVATAGNGALPALCGTHGQPPSEEIAPAPEYSHW